jgi:hypothetical protein
MSYSSRGWRLLSLTFEFIISWRRVDRQNAQTSRLCSRKRTATLKKSQDYVDEVERRLVRKEVYEIRMKGFSYSRDFRESFQADGCHLGPQLMGHSFCSTTRD